MPDLRQATLADARNLARIAELTFRETFAIDNTAVNLDLYCRNHYGEAQQAREISDPAMLTFLYEKNDEKHGDKGNRKESDKGGELAGFAQLRWGNPPECIVASKPGELQRLYVLERWHGQGVASELMQASIKAMQQRGFDCLWLGVWERNFRALAFYKKVGFVAVGEHVFHLGTSAQRDLLMARPV